MYRYKQKFNFIFSLALKNIHAIDNLRTIGNRPNMTTNETNIIEFKKPVKETTDHSENKGKSIIYDSFFTPELHQQLLEKARSENGSH